MDVSEMNVWLARAGEVLALFEMNTSRIRSDSAPLFGDELTKLSRGIPATMVFSGTFAITTAPPAASPMVTPGMMMALLPIKRCLRF
jgi:hypothetical protein